MSVARSNPLDDNRWNSESENPMLSAPGIKNEMRFLTTIGLDIFRSLGLFTPFQHVRDGSTSRLLARKLGSSLRVFKVFWRTGNKVEFQVCGTGSLDYYRVYNPVDGDTTAARTPEDSQAHRGIDFAFEVAQMHHSTITVEHNDDRGCLLVCDTAALSPIEDHRVSLVSERPAGSICISGL